MPRAPGLQVSVMTKARDGGGIYVNGYCNEKYTNVISDNWVDHDVNVGAGLIYLDNGASHIPGCLIYLDFLAS